MEKTKRKLDSTTEEGRLELLVFDLNFNGIYHSMRAGFFSALQRFITLIIFVCSSGAFATLVSRSGGSNSWWEAGLILVLASASLFSLIYDLPNRAKQHEILQLRFFELHAKVVEMENTEANRSKVRAEMLVLFGTEPPTFFAVSNVAYNKALEAIGAEKAKLRRIRIDQQMFGHFYPYKSAYFPKNSSSTS